MAQFYTLDEAARVLGMNPEDLKAEAQQRKVRAFLDGGTWRFRVGDVDELARRRGMGSDAELPLSDLDLPARSGGTVDRGDRSLRVPARGCRPRPGRPDDGGGPEGSAGVRLRRSGHPARRPVAAPDHHGVELGDHRHANDRRPDAERFRRPPDPRQHRGLGFAAERFRRPPGAPWSSRRQAIPT